MAGAGEYAGDVGFGDGVAQYVYVVEGGERVVVLNIISLCRQVESSSCSLPPPCFLTKTKRESPSCVYGLSAVYEGEAALCESLVALDNGLAENVAVYGVSWLISR